MATVLVFVMVIAACGGAESGDTTVASEEPTTTEAAATTTEAPAATTTEGPAATTTEAQAATTTEAPAGGEGMVPDPATGVTLAPYAGENITNGDVFLYWYREAGGGNFLALYTGPGVAESEGQALCPGNSIAAPDFIHISNTPVEDGSCESFTTETASVQVCSGGVWIYRTAISGDLEGTLYGSLEWNAADGAVKGLTSQFPTTEDIGEFEYGLASYSLWDGFTSDGSSVITCSDPT